MQTIDFNFPATPARTGGPRISALLFLCLATTLFLSLAALPAYAQFRASLSGTVTDPSGAVVPGATVTLVDKDTNATRTSTSSDSGFYTFNALPPDHFSLTAERQGFKKKQIAAVTLIPEQPNTLNLQLELGDVQQTVTVNGSAAPLIDTDTATEGATISSNEIQHMPSFGRDVFQLTQLAPGAISDGAQAAGGGTFNLPGSQGPGGTSANAGIFQTENGPQADANGGQYETNAITVDGISTVSAVWGGTTVITPTEDSVANVKVVTNNYDAENGRFSGALTQVTSKSGTNQFHGSLFFQAHRPGLDAYQRYNGPAFYTSGATTPSQKGLLRDSQRFNQMGGSVGGPIWKNKIFGFFAYETIRNNSSVTGTGWYDTSDFDGLAPSGSIASQFLTFPGAGVKSTGIVSETCAEAGLIEGTSCATIAGKGLNIGSPLTTALGTQDPTWTSSPNDPGVGSGLSNVADIANFATVNPTSTVESQYNGRVDADVTSKDHLTGTLYWVPVNTTNYNGGDRAYNLFHHNAVNNAFSLIWNHVFSPTLLNEARVNAAGWRWNEIADNPQAPVGLPQVGIGSIGSISLNQFGSALGSHLDQWTYGYKDVATKVAGRHTIKFGGEFTRLYYLNDPIGRPGYNFFNVWDFLNDAPKEEYGSFNTVTGLPGGSRADNRENLFGLFVQDGWKVMPNLTLSIGLRYGYFGPLYNKQNNLSVVQFGAGADLLTGMNLRQGGSLWTPQKGNFGPQFGFNWSPSAFNQRLVISGGYGLNYNQEEIAISANSNYNPPTAGYYDFTSVNPSSINPNILYGISSNPKSLSGFASNPNTITTYNSNHLPVAGSANVTGFPSNLPTAYSEHYSLKTEYDLGHHLVASLGYQGSTSHHLINQYNENAVAAALGVPLNPLVTSVDFYGNEAASNNNMMLAELNHQFAHGFSADAQFTWAKSMDDGSGPYEEDAYPYYPEFARGRSDFNVGKSFKLYGMWQPVFFHGSQSLLEKIAGGWTLSGILNLHTGFGWTPTYYTQTLYYNGCCYGSLRPRYLGGAGHSTSNDSFKSGPGVGDGQNTNFPDILTSVTTTATSYSNKYFEVPDYSAAVAGSSFPGVAARLPPPPGIARNSFTGPGYRDVDLSVTKAFGLPTMPVLGEDAKFEIRADAFNLFNLLNFNPGSISNNINAPNFGQAQSALGSRTVSLQARFSF
jgi:Carboxypeptidase regulatory-like domain